MKKIKSTISNLEDTPTVSKPKVDFIEEVELSSFIEELVETGRESDRYNIKLSIDKINFNIKQLSEPNQKSIEVDAICSITNRKKSDCLDFKCDSMEVGLVISEMYQDMIA